MGNKFEAETADLQFDSNQIPGNGMALQGCEQQ
jgi:hypothetical protein